LKSHTLEEIAQARYQAELDIVRLERKAESGVILSIDELTKLTGAINKLKKINEGIERVRGEVRFSGLVVESMVKI